jgi:uncharacterized membrane protein YdjX (TVP38/TMEM64 family)
MTELSREDTRKLIVSVTLVGILAIALLASWLMGWLNPVMSKMVQIFSGRENLRSYVESWGTWAPAIFMVIQALQVVFAPIPGELTGAVGGFIFGVAPNILYSTIGLTIGSMFAFTASRLIGLPLVKLVVPEDSMEHFGFLTRSRGILLAAVFFTFPGFPKDILSYILGLSPMGYVTFLLVCGLGRIPGTIMLSYSGAAVYHENWTLVIVLSVFCAILVGIAYFWRERIERWLRTRSNQPV